MAPSKRYSVANSSRLKALLLLAFNYFKAVVSTANLTTSVSYFVLSVLENVCGQIVFICDAVMSGRFVMFVVKQERWSFIADN